MATATLAALTDPKSQDYVSGNKKVKYRQWTGPASYTIAGDTIVPSDVGLRHITAITLPGGAVVPGTLTGAFIVAASKVASSETWKITCYTAAGSPGTGTALGEVASTTNLSTYKAVLRIEGY